ncbi:alpha-mannosidase [Paeniglutamicibacter sp. R2-26]|uniref:alpha-mannosidase n=1 Tax=Paeniglutamicibacter sp. R2-26 TaxID=3144417 RepID=UPI003EE5AB05
MHEQTSLTIGRARRVLEERIRPAIHSNHLPADVSFHELPSEPIPAHEGLALDYAPFRVGSTWGAAWGTTWFKVRADVPAAWSGKRVELLVDLGFDISKTGFQCEGLVYRPDGSSIKSLNPRNQWVPVAESASGGEEVLLYIEAASNPVLLQDHPFLPTREGDILTSSREPLYRTRRFDLAVLEREVYELALDLDVLLELQAELPEGARRAQILRSLDDALDELDLQDIAGTAAATRARLAPVLAAPASSTAHALSAVGHAHIDSAWLWPVRETMRKVARTCSSMLELIDEDPDFLYGMSSAQQYKWLKVQYPEIFARIKKAVADGRFLPLGGMWVESDTVMPSGESLVRQFLHGQGFFRREFGIGSEGVWLPDSFGYSPALPQLIRKAGFEWFFTQKISWNQVNRFPHHSFAWEGIDGSRIFTHFPPMDTYNAQLSGAEVALAERQFRDARAASGSIAPVGWGDGGGGTTREMAGRASRMADLEGNPTVRWEHPNDFFERTREEYVQPPVWVGELYLELHRATLTSQHRMKAGNRRSEHLLVEAELWCATAALRGDFEYPHDELDALWESVLLHQFHDILPGTSIAWVHREAVTEYERIAAAVQELIERALGALTGPGSRQIAVNPAPVAGAVPAGSGREAVPHGLPAVRVSSDASGTRLLNDLVDIRFSPEGLIVSAIDLASGREAIAPGQVANLLQLHQDFPNQWDAWDVDKFYRNRVTDLREVTSMHATANEDGSAVLEILRPVSADSTVRQTIVLEPGSRTLHFHQVTDWHETEKFLKVAFALDIRAEHTIAETQFGHFKRVTHANTSWEAAKFETSMHRFIHVEEPGFGVGLVNDSSYGYDVTRQVDDRANVSTTARLSLLRAPRFPDPEADQGLHEHRYGMVIGADLAQTTAAGIALNSPGRTVAGGSGFEPLVELSGHGLLLSCVKLAADRSGDVIVRLHESLGRRASGSLQVNAPLQGWATASLIEDVLGGEPGGSGATIPLELKPFEVLTLRFTPGAGS